MLLLPMQKSIQRSGRVQNRIVIYSGSPINVSDGKRHSITLTIGLEHDGKLYRNEISMSEDGHTTQMKKEDLEADSLNKMDPFFGGLPSYTIGL